MSIIYICENCHKLKRKNKDLKDQLEIYAQTNANLIVRLSEEVTKRNELEDQLEEFKRLLRCVIY